MLKSSILPFLGDITPFILPVLVIHNRPGANHLKPDLLTTHFPLRFSFDRYRHHACRLTPLYDSMVMHGNHQQLK